MMSADRFFFLVGPLRTGSSLMARCIDDHPECICLCESEINRALFNVYDMRLHMLRMETHGFQYSDVLNLLDGKKQDTIGGLMSWYRDVHPRFAELLGKSPNLPLGDKSPDFFKNPAIIEHLAANYPLIYTVRDPRAIFHSIDSQDDATPKEKITRWRNLVGNYAAWKGLLDQRNILAIRYEDLVSQPRATMRSVYAHLGLPYADRFLESFPRLFPRRFLWESAVDWATGANKDFDVGKIDGWRGHLSVDHAQFVNRTPHVHEFMEQFGYR